MLWLKPELSKNRNNLQRRTLINCFQCRGGRIIRHRMTHDPGSLVSCSKALIRSANIRAFLLSDFLNKVEHFLKLWTIFKLLTND
jgi:hypothetical protein